MIEDYNSVFTIEILTQMLKGKFVSRDRKVKETDFVE